jgi:hypothetical protein
MKWSGGGAVAARYNSNNGIGTPPSTGPSEWLDIHFAQKLFVEGQQEVGVAHALGKDAFYAGPGMPMKYWCLQELNYLGDPALRFIPSELGVEEGEGGGLPSQGVLLTAPSPNPFVSSCTIGYSMPSAGSARIDVFDMSGRLVRTIHDGLLPAAAGDVVFDGHSSSGERLPSGVYAAVLTSGYGTATTSLLLLR